MSPRRSLVWFRRDLRVHDHSALDAAVRWSDDGVVALWVVSPDEWRSHDDAPVKVDFWLRNLRCLAGELAARNIPLRIAHAAHRADVPAVVCNVARDTHCSGVFWNREYEIDEHRRDRATEAALQTAGCVVAHFDDRVAVAPNAVRTGAGTTYTVFTPFRRAWCSALAQRGYDRLPAPATQPKIDVVTHDVPTQVEGFASSIAPERWPAGEVYAHARLKAFARDAISHYATQRDLPAVDGTSALSPYLAAGVLSVRQCIAAAASVNGGAIDVGNPGPVTWVSELAWRDFYQHVMVHAPRVCMGRAFKRETEKVRWANDPAGLARWCEGRTGFPLVDAAMRQLATLGWMHNRLRMVTAMFLSKDLLIDWREGERFFMRSLVDGDLGANNGGWQWSASTGTDAQPYFRVFNPSSQSARYDADGAFIRHWVPELRSVATKLLHAPEKIPPAVRTQVGYPAPMVDHDMARQRAIAAFRDLPRVP
jgi:deoxyribodipyrimidine photo-lyase